MKYFNFLLVSIFFTIISCKPVDQKIISRETLDKNIVEIKKIYTDLDSAKIEFFDRLSIINKGREEYVKMEDRLLKRDSTTTIDDFIVSANIFDRKSDSIFNYFKSNKITYRQVFNEFDSIKYIQTKYEPQLQEVYQEINEYCIRSQNQVEKLIEEDKHALEEYDRSISFKVKAFKKYKSKIQVTVTMMNNTYKRVDQIGFTLKFIERSTSKEVASLILGSDDSFYSSDEGTWTYEESSYNYNKLKNIDISRVEIKADIHRITLAGRQIWRSDLGNNYSIHDYKYEEPEELFGYCPYLKRGSKLYSKKRKLRKKIELEISKVTPIITQYYKLESFTDFS